MDTKRYFQVNIKYDEYYLKHIPQKTYLKNHFVH